MEPLHFLPPMHTWCSEFQHLRKSTLLGLPSKVPFSLVHVVQRQSVYTTTIVVLQTAELTCKACKITVLQRFAGLQVG